jgi:hypothetical protein
VALPRRPISLSAAGYVLTAALLGAGVGFLRSGTAGGGVALGVAVGLGVALGLVAFEALRHWG